MPTFLGVWSLGLFSLTFFSTSSKKKKLAFVFDHDIKTFEGVMVKHSRAFLLDTATWSRNARSSRSQVC